MECSRYRRWNWILTFNRDIDWNPYSFCMRHFKGLYISPILNLKLNSSAFVRIYGARHNMWVNLRNKERKEWMDSKIELEMMWKGDALALFNFLHPLEDSTKKSPIQVPGATCHPHVLMAEAQVVNFPIHAIEAPPSLISGESALGDGESSIRGWMRWGSMSVLMAHPSRHSHCKTKCQELESFAQQVTNLSNKNFTHGELSVVQGWLNRIPNDQRHYILLEHLRSIIALITHLILTMQHFKNTQFYYIKRTKPLAI